MSLPAEGLPMTARHGAGVAAARRAVFRPAARAIAPRKPLTVSQWADLERRLSSKSSAEPGRWRTDRNPMLREPMDTLSARSPVHETVLMFPIQLGKTEVALNVLGYVMDHHPGPVMVVLPGEASMRAWVAQKLGPMIDETPAVQRVLTSTDSRNGANRAEFKDYLGGQLYIEHAGSAQRLKSKTVRVLIVDELDEFASATTGGDDPIAMLDGRTSAFPGTYKRLYISTPTLAGVSRIAEKYAESDQRRYHVPCPHCGHEQPLVWSGLHWDAAASACWYVCRDCAATIDESHKPAMLAAGRWIPEHPERRTRGYALNALYYALGLGPRWLDLVEQFRKACRDPAKLKTFTNDRLAEVWEDPAMRQVKHNVIADRAESYRLRTAPPGVLEVTAGVDTQDNRLAVHIIGWGRGLSAWTLDYVELPGDPADATVWDSLVDLLNRPIETHAGGSLRVAATAIDAGGHRTEAVKAFVRARRIRRPLCIFGAVPNNAPVLSKGKLEDISWNGRTDRHGVTIHHVGTVAIKHLLYSRLSADHDKQPDARLVRFSEDLGEDWFRGLTSETYNPAKNRFEHRRGAGRNEVLDTWVYAYAATHHPELRLHRRTRSEWDAAAARLANTAPAAVPAPDAAPASGQPPRLPSPPPPPPAAPRRGSFLSG